MYVSMTKDKDKPDLVAKKLQNTTLIIATPCYGGAVTELYTQSMFNLVTLCMQYGVSLGYTTIANESLVTRARNELVNTFMKSNATHLMFIDADIQFNAKDVIRMILADVDVIAGSYPLKTIDWQMIAESAKKGQTELEEIKRSAINYVVNIHKPDSEMVGKTVDVTVTNGRLEVYDAGTGFMLIKRHVIEQMIEAYPETMYYSDKDMTDTLENRKRYALFDTMIDSEQRYLSEDYTFCRRWQALGGKIHLDVGTILNHVGTMTFPGHPIIRAKQA